MKLTIISHKEFSFNGEEYLVKGGFGKQVEAWLPYFDEITLCVPVKYSKVLVDGYEIKSPKVSFFHLPAFSHYLNKGIWKRFYFLLVVLPLLAGKIARAMKQWELIFIRAPGYLELLGALLSKLHRKPHFLWVSADWRARILATKESFFRRRIGELLDKLIILAIKGSHTFVVGNALYEHYSRFNPLVHQTATTIISKKDISSKETVGQMDFPIGILFVGRVEPEKGLEYLVESIQVLDDKGIQAILEIVGDGSFKQELEKKVKQLHFSDRIKFHGYIPWGSNLMEAYKRANIFVLPSLSEGQPKVIFEALANGIPFISTKVGGIPTIIKDGINGLLIEPKSASAIANAIERLISDPTLRIKLIHEGFKTVEGFTVEKVTADMIEILKQEFPIEKTTKCSSKRDY